MNLWNPNENKTEMPLEKSRVSVRRLGIPLFTGGPGPNSGKADTLSPTNRAFVTCFAESFVCTELNMAFAKTRSSWKSKVSVDNYQSHHPSRPGEVSVERGHVNFDSRSFPRRKLERGHFARSHGCADNLRLHTWLQLQSLKYLCCRWPRLTPRQYQSKVLFLMLFSSKILV